VSQLFGKRDWRIWLGIVVSIIWTAAGIWYVSSVYEYDPGQTYSLDAVGSFLEGVFAPLAFLWLILGMFMQQRELADNTEAIRRTAEQSEKQTLAIAATEMNARQGTFFKIADSVKQQLGGISGLLLVSSVGPAGSGLIDREESGELFTLAASGDWAVFARRFLSEDFEEEGGLVALFYGTEIRQRHTQNFRQTFERLCRLASNCDVDGIIEDTLRHTALGLLYQRMLEHEPEDKEALVNDQPPA
jgi:hypothetical protein